MKRMRTRDWMAPMCNSICCSRTFCSIEKLSFDSWSKIPVSCLFSFFFSSLHFWLFSDSAVVVVDSPWVWWWCHRVCQFSRQQQRKKYIYWCRSKTYFPGITKFICCSITDTQHQTQIVNERRNRPLDRSTERRKPTKSKRLIVRHRHEYKIFR